MESQKPATPVMDVHSPAPATPASANDKPNDAQALEAPASAHDSQEIHTEAPKPAVSPRPKRDSARGVIAATIIVTLALAGVAISLYYQQRTQPTIVESPIVTK